jgi:hydrogenase large subunit
VHDHLVHFYHLHALDWVDVVRRSRPTPSDLELAQSISATGRCPAPGYFRDIQNRLKKFVESASSAPSCNGYWGHPAYKLPPKPT